MWSHAGSQIVNGAPDHEREKDPNAIHEKNTNCPPDVGAAVLPQVGEEGPQVLQQHELVDAILPAAGAGWRSGSRPDRRFWPGVDVSGKVTAKAAPRSRIHPARNTKFEWLRKETNDSPFMVIESLTARTRP